MFHNCYRRKDHTESVRNEHASNSILFVLNRTKFNTLLEGIQNHYTTDLNNKTTVYVLLLLLKLLLTKNNYFYFYKNTELGRLNTKSSYNKKE